MGRRFPALKAMLSDVVVKPFHLMIGNGALPLGGDNDDIGRWELVVVSAKTGSQPPFELVPPDAVAIFFRYDTS